MLKLVFHQTGLVKRHEKLHIKLLKEGDRGEQGGKEGGGTRGGTGEEEWKRKNSP